MVKTFCHFFFFSSLLFFLGGGVIFWGGGGALSTHKVNTHSFALELRS